MSRALRLARRLALIALALVALVALALWILRDQPRRLVERIIAEQLDATVHLGRLELLGPRRFALHDLRVELERAGWSIRTRIERAGVAGDVRQINLGRFESIEIGGGEVRVARVAAPVGEPAPSADTPLTIGRLRIERSRLTLDSGAGSSTLALGADLRGIGDVVSGEVGLDGTAVATGPLFRLAAAEDLDTLRARLGVELETNCPSLSIGLRLPGDGTAVFETGGSCPLPLRVDPTRRIELPHTSVHLGAPDAVGLASLAIRVELPERFEVDAEARMSIETGAIVWSSIDGRIDDLATVVALAGTAAGGATLAGHATVAAQSGADGTWTIHASVDASRAAWADEQNAVEAAPLALRTTLVEQADRWAVHGAVELGALSGSIGDLRLPPGFGPVLVELDSTVVPDPLAVSITTAGARVDRLRRISLSGEMRADPQGATLAGVRIRIPDVDVGGWIELARRIGFDVPAVTLGGTSTLEIRADGPLASPTLTAELAIADGRWESTLDPGDGRVVLDAVRLNTRVVRRPNGVITASAARLSGMLTYPELPTMPLELETTAAVTLDGSRVEIPSATLTVTDLITTEIRDLHVDGESLDGRLGLRVPTVDLARLLEWSGPPPQLVGYSLAAPASVDLLLEWDGTGAWQVDGSGRLERVEIASEDFSRVGQGLATSATFRLDGASGQLGRGRLEARPAGFELLSGAFYGDWTAIAPHATLEFDRPDSGEPSAWRVRAGVALDPHTRLDAMLDASAAETRFEATLGAENLSTAFATFVRAPLAGSYPRLDETLLTGRFSAVASGEMVGDLVHVGGTLELAEIDWSGWAEGLGIVGMTLRLPFDLATRDGGASYSGPSCAGELEFRRIDVLGVAVPSVTTELEVIADTVRLVEPVSFPLLGGTVTLDRLAVADIFGATPGARSGLAIRDVQLAALAPHLGLPPLDGTLHGAFPGIRLSQQELEVDGGGALSVFGGTVELSGISGRNILGDYPQFAFSAEFRDLDLGQATRTFDVGEMSGVAQGYIRDCTLFAGTPTGFDALFETVRRKGTKQSITVKAINNIAILGTGGSVSVFDRGIHRFFDRYTYEKLGIRARLSNDSFLLTGTEKRGAQELFLKGRLPFRIDIVNVRPGRSVSFRAMTERLRSVDLGGASTGEN